MELTNEFRVGVPVERAWEVLTDVELIAPCMPGAQLQEIEGDEYRGVVKVKVGPITAQYKGAARFLEKDEAAHRVVLRAEGRETRGQGNANATITATMDPDGDGTKVAVVTDLTVTGRVAQFGRGVLADVSSKLLGQFVDCLEGKLGEDTGASGGAASSTQAPAPVATGGRPGHRQRGRRRHGPPGDTADPVGLGRAGVVVRRCRRRCPPQRHVGPRGPGRRLPGGRAGRPPRRRRRPGRQADRPRGGGPHDPVAAEHLHPPAPPQALTIDIGAPRGEAVECSACPASRAATSEWRNWQTR